MYAVRRSVVLRLILAQRVEISFNAWDLVSHETSGTVIHSVFGGPSANGTTSIADIQCQHAGKLTKIFKLETVDEPKEGENGSQYSSGNNVYYARISIGGSKL